MKGETFNIKIKVPMKQRIDALKALNYNLEGAITALQDIGLSANINVALQQVSIAIMISTFGITALTGMPVTAYRFEEEIKVYGWTDAQVKWWVRAGEDSIEEIEVIEQMAELAATDRAYTQIKDWTKELRKLGDLD